MSTGGISSTVMDSTGERRCRPSKSGHQEASDHERLFAELKTKTENVHERSVRVLWEQQNGRTLQRTSAEASQGQSRVRRTKKAAGKEVVDVDVTHLAQAHQKLSTRVEARMRDMEASTCCVHSYQKRERERDREKMQTAGRICRDMVEYKPDVDGGSTPRGS